MVHRVPKTRRFGRGSNKAWRRLSHSRCWLNGEEVTLRCFYADPRRGVVRLYIHDENGRVLFDRVRGEARTEERRGRVKCFVSKKKVKR